MMHSGVGEISSTLDNLIIAISFLHLYFLRFGEGMLDEPVTLGSLTKKGLLCHLSHILVEIMPTFKPIILF